VERALNTGWNEFASSIEPLYNVFVGPNEVIITIDLPYLDDASVRVRVAADDTIDVSAGTSKVITMKELGMSHRSAEFTRYHARIRLPVPVDEAGIRTKVKHGVLEVRIPRTP
jgi:HSP20 family molecular chaperone IbpA